MGIGAGCVTSFYLIQSLINGGVYIWYNGHLVSGLEHKMSQASGRHGDFECGVGPGSLSVLEGGRSLGIFSMRRFGVLETERFDDGTMKVGSRCLRTSRALDG